MAATALEMNDFVLFSFFDHSEQSVIVWEPDMLSFVFYTRSMLRIIS